MSQVDEERISETFYFVIVPGIGHKGLVASVSQVLIYFSPRWFHS